MSAGAHSFSNSACNAASGPEVLEDLLHSLSQPLTSLRCSLEQELEFSLEGSVGGAERKYERVVTALQQMEDVIEMVELMREYLDADDRNPKSSGTALAPVLRSVFEELETVAAVRGVRFRLTGTSSAQLPIPEARLRTALQYVMAAVIDTQPVGGTVTMRLDESPAGTTLWIEGSGSSSNAIATLSRVRLAIASRVFESYGASLRFENSDARSTGYVLSIPQFARLS
jgi:hypothetical protein